VVDSARALRGLRSLHTLGYGFGRKRSNGDRAEIDPRGLPALIPVSSQYLRGVRAAIYILEFGGFPFATQHLINHFQNYRGDKGEMVDSRITKEKIVSNDLFKPGASVIRAVMAVLQKTHTVVIPVTWDLEETRRMVENRVPTELKVLAWEQPYILDAGSGSYKIIQLVVDLDAANIVVEDAKRDLDPNVTVDDSVKLTDLPTIFKNPEGTVLTERLGAHPEGLDDAALARRRSVSGPVGDETIGPWTRLDDHSLIAPVGSEYPAADVLDGLFPNG
jgi:hypothetical protein